MDNWKISLDQDGSTATDLSEFFGSSIYVNVGIPKVKYNALSVLGHQGDIDMTAAYNGEVFYEPRECTVIIMSNLGTDMPASIASALINIYFGQRVRLQNITQDYMLIGRLTEAEYEELSNGKDYKIRFKLIAEPLRYSLTEQVIDDTQLALTTPANQWATLTAGKAYATQTGFSASAGNLPIITIDIAPESETATPRYFRFEVSNLVNCTVRAFVEEFNGDRKQVDISQPILDDNTHDRIVLDINPIDSNAAVSGDVYVGTYPAIIYDNGGKSVPVKARQTISTANNDIYLVVNGMSAKLKSGWEFHEYPQLMLKNDMNYIMAYASKMDFDQSSLNPSWDYMQIKWREGEL